MDDSDEEIACQGQEKGEVYASFSLFGSSYKLLLLFDPRSVDHSLILISTRALWTITLTLSQTIADPTS
jgi:hypothetical protein